jgi:hypothetical protein
VRLLRELLRELIRLDRREVSLVVHTWLRVMASSSPARIL